MLSWVAPSGVTHRARPKFRRAGPRYAQVFLDCEEAQRTVFARDLYTDRAVTCFLCLTKRI